MSITSVAFQLNWLFNHQPSPTRLAPDGVVPKTKHAFLLPPSEIMAMDAAGKTVNADSKQCQPNARGRMPSSVKVKVTQKLVMMQQEFLDIQPDSMVTGRGVWCTRMVSFEVGSQANSK